MKKIPMRTCAVSQEKCPKGELIRIVRNKDGEVFVDLSGKMNGRGVYLKRDMEVLNKARKSKILNKRLEVFVPDSIYDEIMDIINE
jgi:uncharacterized protein